MSNEVSFCDEGPMQTRTQLIELIGRATISAACRRACLTGKVEVLGGFSSTPPRDLPGWIVDIVTKHGRDYRVVVGVDEVNHQYRVDEVTDDPPWEHWVGRYDPAGWAIMAGDNPLAYAERKKAAMGPGEPYISLTTVPAIVEARNLPTITRQTVYNWAVIGVKGGQLKLRVDRRRGRLFTTLSWVNEFLDEYK